MHYQHFSIQEREKIQYLLWQKQSVRAIAQTLGRSPASVSREIRRNGGQQIRRYVPRIAQERALTKRHSRGRIERLKNPEVRTYVVDQLSAGYSPEQIAGRIQRDMPGSSISQKPSTNTSTPKCTAKATVRSSQAV